MARKLWIMRHGLAENEFDTDFSRALAATGRQETLDVTTQLLADSATSEGRELPTEMIVSPFKRTQQTAQIVCQKLGLGSTFTTDEMLVHFADHRILGDYLLAQDTQQLMIVSHMPIVAYLCQYLDPGCGIQGFHTAQIVRLDADNNGQPKLKKIYTPS